MINKNSKVSDKINKRAVRLQMCLLKFIQRRFTKGDSKTRILKKKYSFQSSFGRKSL